MAFENISKGEFKSNLIDLDNFGIAAVSTESKVIAQCNFNDSLTEERKDNTEFIAFCFNLQQRYDISKLEETVNTLEELLGYGLLNQHYAKSIEQLLKQIKK